MLSANSLVNHPIIAAKTAAVLGNLSGILIDPYLCRIAAFTLHQTTLKAQVVLPWVGVKLIDSGQVFAWASTMIVKADELFDIRRLLQEGTIKQDIHFRSADGTFLGMMHDSYFDQQSGAILKYEVVGGPFASAETERGFIPAIAATKVEKEAGTAYLPLDLAALARLIEEES